MRKTRVSLIAATAGLVALAAATVSPAQADTNTGSTTTLVAVGSDTSQDVMEGLSQVIKDSNGNPVISNYKAIPVGRNISTRSNNPNCTFTAPKNSGQGIDALSAAMLHNSFGTADSTGKGASSNMTGCVDIARSSGTGTPTTSPGVGSMTYIPYATDAVTFATRSTSAVPHQLNLTDLQAIYTANTGNCIFSPLLPPIGSGTRKFWATLMGVKDGTPGTTGSWGSCVKDTTASGVPIQEHNGTFLTGSDMLVPISVAQWIGQADGVIADIRGEASLGAIDFQGQNGAASISPLQMQTTFGSATRPIYNVVPTAEITSGNSAYNQTMASTLVGPTSAVCQAGSTIAQYGFGPSPATGANSCGNTSLTNPN